MFLPKLIVTDLDGSALRNDKTVSPATRDAFFYCHQKGIPIGIATARYIYGAKPFAQALYADYSILTDGTLLYQKEQLLYSNAMTLEVTNHLLRLLVQLGHTSHIAVPTTQGLFRYPVILPGHEGCRLIDLNKPFPYNANKMVVELPSPQVASYIASQCGCSYLRYRGEDRYTFFDPTASKLTAISYIAQNLNISLADVLVFGDDRNDIEMIRHCGCGVAMGNALKEVKDAATFVTDSNENDGIARFLTREVIPFLN